MAITTTPHSSFERDSLHLIEQLDYDTNKYILTIQYNFSKFVEAYQLKTKESSKVANVCFSNFILRYGIPNEILTDRGTKFMSNTTAEVYRILGVTQFLLPRDLGFFGKLS